MALLDHIHACNRWTPGDFVPLWLDNERIGRLRRDRAALLADMPVFGPHPRGGLSLWRESPDAGAAGAALEARLRPIADADPEVGPWRGEKLDVAPAWGAAPRLRLERCLIPLLGLRAYGVHVNAFVTTADGPALWTARRAMADRTFPGQLDHMVAGGIASGHGAFDTVVKEAWEEAGVEAELARRARPVGVVSYRVESGGGLRDDALFCYDLEVPHDFTPRAIDGEVERFDLRPAAQVIAALRDGGGYKFNVPLVIIDFALRHGLLTPENEPDYVALARGLRSGEAEPPAD